MEKQNSLNLEIIGLQFKFSVTAQNKILRNSDLKMKVVNPENY